MRGHRGLMRTEIAMACGNGFKSKAERSTRLIVIEVDALLLNAATNSITF
jgi:hypothetical protein